MAASMTETLDIRRKRLLFRSWHRGTKEADLLLGSFAERHLAGFTPEQVDRYEALLGADDGDLLAWIAGRAVPPAERESDVLRLLLAFEYAPRPA
jgi:antitoxin CptB